MTFEWIDREGKPRKEDVALKFSIAKNTTRAGHGYNPKIDDQGKGGNQEHGLHMKRNLGLSIVRERRELELDDGYSVGAGNAPWERWWGSWQRCRPLPPQPLLRASSQLEMRVASW